MRKKDYQKPTMKVVKLKQQPVLLLGSVGANREDYDDVIPETWSARELMDDDLNVFFK